MSIRVAARAFVSPRKNRLVPIGAPDDGSKTRRDKTGGICIMSYVWHLPARSVCAYGRLTPTTRLASDLLRRGCANVYGFAVGKLGRARCRWRSLCLSSRYRQHTLLNYPLLAAAASSG